MWNNYILSFTNNNISRTYNGMTNNIDRRLNQHNNILSGGAKATTNLIKKYPENKWKFICIIKGFDSKSEAMKAEWRIRHPDNKKRRPNKFNKAKGRILALNYILSSDDRWTKTSQYIKEQNLEIYIDDYYKDLLERDLLEKHNLRFFSN